MEANPLGLSLEPEAQAMVETTEILPYFFTIPPSRSRQLLEELQATGWRGPAVDEDWYLVNGGPTGTVNTRIVRPPGVEGPLPAILFIHGGGWVMGSASTHDRLVRELAVGTGAAVVFPEYSLSPEATYPTALEECYTVLGWMSHESESLGLDPTRIAIVGDQMGGNIAAAIALLAPARGAVELQAQVLFYPATDASFDTESYRLFAEGYSMRAEQNRWFWDQYCPDKGRRSEMTVAPLQADLDTLSLMPPTTILTAEADCLRDEGEAYASRLREAGVPVLSIRYQGVINAFVLLNTLRATRAANSAVVQAVASLKEAFAIEPHQPTDS